MSGYIVCVVHAGVVENIQFTHFYTLKSDNNGHCREKRRHSKRRKKSLILRDASTEIPFSLSQVVRANRCLIFSTARGVESEK
jgi:hypothetical protein